MVESLSHKSFKFGTFYLKLDSLRSAILPSVNPLIHLSPNKVISTVNQTTWNSVSS